MNTSRSKIWIAVVMTFSCIASAFAQYQVKESEGNKSVVAVESIAVDSTPVVVELPPSKPYKNPCSEKTFSVRGFTNIRVAHIQGEDGTRSIVLCKEPSEEAFQPSD